MRGTNLRCGACILLGSVKKVRTDNEMMEELGCALSERPTTARRSKETVKWGRANLNNEAAAAALKQILADWDPAPTAPETPAAASSLKSPNKKKAGRAPVSKAE